VIPRPTNLSSMSLAEAAAHVAALAALAWLLRRVRAREALAIVADRLSDTDGGCLERVAARSAERLCQEAGRLGMETGAAGLEGER
jgi:hypothetical protein